MAETYGIMDYKALPVKTLAALCFGLRDNSRIKMKISGASVQPEILLLAAAVDRLSFLVCAKTKDAETGNNRPDSFVDILLGIRQESDTVGFDTAEEYEAARAEIMSGG